MRGFLRRWIGRTRHIPPRDFWPTLVHFLWYAFVQAAHSSRRNDDDPAGRLQSHLNFKRAHYLEKAMLCDYGRSAELDVSFEGLAAYLESPQGKEDDCYLYLRKLVDEYGNYPDGFTCFMRDVKSKRRPATDPKTLRRIIVQRRSRRQFVDRPLPDEIIRQLVEAGSHSPTSCNAQPLAFITLTDRRLIDLVFGSARGADSWKAGIPAGIVIATDRRHYKPVEQHPVMFQDIAAATQNCLLMAEALGLSACWVSLVSDSHIENQSDLYSELDLPDHMLIGAAIAVGEPANAVCHVPHRPLENVWHRERFSRR